MATVERPAIDSALGRIFPPMVFSEPILVEVPATQEAAYFAAAPLALLDRGEIAIPMVKPRRWAEFTSMQNLLISELVGKGRDGRRKLAKQMFDQRLECTYVVENGAVHIKKRPLEPSGGASGHIGKFKRDGKEFIIAMLDSCHMDDWYDGVNDITRVAVRALTDRGVICVGMDGAPLYKKTEFPQFYNGKYSESRRTGYNSF